MINGWWKPLVFSVPNGLSGAGRQVETDTLKPETRPERLTRQPGIMLGGGHPLALVRCTRPVC